MAIKPWYKVVTPREDLRSGQPIDAAQFAVSLEQVRDGSAREDYADPARFFDRTYLTEGLKKLAAEVTRRLAGDNTANAIYSLITQFGGGKTHALALLYHLARGPEAEKWDGVPGIKLDARVKSMPAARIGVFVGNEFDGLTGRGGDDGTPLRKTPWGELAWQLGGQRAFDLVARHDAAGVAPGGDVVRQFLPEGPCLLLLDEVMNYVSRVSHTDKTKSEAFYDFIHVLTEAVESRPKAVLVVSLPASESEIAAGVHEDYKLLRKVLDRLSQAIVASDDMETSEIIRRRLFETVGEPSEYKPAIDAYVSWIEQHKLQLPGWFGVDHAREQFMASYPFHPSLLAVFRRKWQTLPDFQRTRGALRLLALWVAKVSTTDYKGAYKDALIEQGTAPLDDPRFRAALVEQLGADSKLHAVITTDICGGDNSHAIRLDEEASEAIRKARLYRKVATSILFESSGGQQGKDGVLTATLPELRLATGEPDLDVGNIDAVAQVLGNTCYFLKVDVSGYRYQMKPNLNRLIADKQGNIKDDSIRDKARAAIQRVFGPGSELRFFPNEPSDLPDTPELKLAIAPPSRSMNTPKETQAWLKQLSLEAGKGPRGYRNALVWVVPAAGSELLEAARMALAWEALQQDQDALELDEHQRKEVAAKRQLADRELEETVWHTYRHVAMLDLDGELTMSDLGSATSSAARSLREWVIQQLQYLDQVVSNLGPSKLVANWPPALKDEWGLRAVRDAVYSSPLFPRPLSEAVLCQAIVMGVSGGLFALATKTAAGSYGHVYFNQAVPDGLVTFSDECVLLKEVPVVETPEPTSGEGVSTDAGTVVSPLSGSVDGPPPPDSPKIHLVQWSGEVPWQQWTNFYTKALTKLPTSGQLKLTVNFEAHSQEGFAASLPDELKAALRDLKLSDDLTVS